MSLYNSLFFCLSLYSQYEIQALENTAPCYRRGISNRSVCSRPFQIFFFPYLHPALYSLGQIPAVAARTARFEDFYLCHGLLKDLGSGGPFFEISSSKTKQTFCPIAPKPLELHQSLSRLLKADYPGIILSPQPRVYPTHSLSCIQ